MADPNGRDSARKAPSIVFLWEGGDASVWKAGLSATLGDIDFRVYPDVGDVEDVDYVMTWMPPLGVIKQFPNLKAIFSIGAGVSHILRDPEVPEWVPIVRLTDEALSLDMSLHVVYWVLHFHRGYDKYRKQQQTRQWLRHPFPPNEDRKIGVLGMGAIGAVTAGILRDFKFDVAGWSRSKKNIEGVQSFQGDAQLEEFLSRTEILVAVLPPTPATTNLIDRKMLAAMPKGACLINMGRGELIVDADLLEALNSGHIAGAALDVFREEPLPPGNPLWDHPNLYVTPHAAGPTSVKYGARRIGANIMAIGQGRTPSPIYDRSRGY